jgi:hypothetical protein
MGTFAQALETQKIPRNLGDVLLRYEPALLIGEAKTQHKMWTPGVALIVGIGSAVAALALLLFNAPNEWTALLLAFTAAGLFGSFYFSQLEKRRRAFVLNFRDNTLRLDFVTPFAGHPQTMIVPFDEVKAVGLERIADGSHVITVDFARAGQLLRDALIVQISLVETTSAEKFKATLEAAFGLGEIPADSPLHDEIVDEFLA